MQAVRGLPRNGRAKADCPGRTMSMRMYFMEKMERMTDEDIGYIRKAIERAKLSQQESGRPKPRVGAVFVKEGKELGAAHRSELELGQHAEFVLLAQIGSR